MDTGDINQRLFGGKPAAGQKVRSRLTGRTGVVLEDECRECTQSEVLVVFQGEKEMERVHCLEIEKL